MNHQHDQDQPDDPNTSARPPPGIFLSLYSSQARVHIGSRSHTSSARQLLGWPRDVQLTKLTAVHASLESHVREEKQDTFPRISKVWDEAKPEQARTEIKDGPLTRRVWQRGDAPPALALRRAAPGPSGTARSFPCRSGARRRAS